MCCLVVQVCLFVLGIIGLSRGKVSLTRTRIVTGTPARIIGAIFLVPLPVYVLINVIAGVSMFGADNAKPDPAVAAGVGIVALLGVGIIILCLIVGTVLAIVYAEPVVTKRKIRYDDDDDRPRRRRARDDDDDEDRPRRRARDDDDDEHIQPKDRPRRRPRDDDDDDRIKSGD
jgi:hypothetical protein